MAKENTPLDPDRPVTVSDLIAIFQASGQAQNQQLVDAFSQAMSKNAPPKQVQMGDFDPKTPYGNKVTLTRQVFQNGFPLNADQIHDDAKVLLNKIDRSGRYIDRKIEIILSDEGAEESIYIRYRNKNQDDRNEITRRCRSFTDMMQQIITAQEEAEAELIAAGRPPTRKRRPYFEGVALTDANA